MSKRRMYELPEEHLLEIQIEEYGNISLICTNGALHELVIGFLYNEGLIANLGQVERFVFDSEAVVVRIKMNNKNLHVVRTSGLGGMGCVSKTGMILDTEKIVKICRKAVYSKAYISCCMQEMQEMAVEYERTGGMHCSALFDDQKMLAFYEDIGRHNTLDKIAGKCLLEQIPCADTLLITSGRISFDMVRKAHRLGVSVIASYSTPTQRAYEMAEEVGITLIAYLKTDSMRLLCGEESVR